MTQLNIAALINLLGFTTGGVLYAMLLAMVLRRPPHGGRPGTAAGGAAEGLRGSLLLRATAVLGLLWNVGALATYGVRDLGAGEPHPLLLAVSFTSLGFLPAVVVHSVLGGGERAAGPILGRLITPTSYCLSAAAGALHVYAALASHRGPSLLALRALTLGYVLVIGALFFVTRRQPGWKRAVWASALAVFAVSALHLSYHQGGSSESWLRELTGHHASLPLALAILYQDYRFAFADIFLKRALALLALVSLAFGLYVAIAAPLLAAGGARDPRAVVVLLGLWIATALLYPGLRRAAAWFVDKVVLRRAGYGELKAEIAQALSVCETADAVLAATCDKLAPALSARAVNWVPADARDVTETAGGELVRPVERDAGGGALAFIPTAEPPHYALAIGPLTGGRRLLSDDIALLEAVAAAAARRLDALRVTHERCEQVRREQEISKLAAEAQLRALRAQINPHFLFNALTTIGYLVQTAPERALDTLMKLTSLLRAVLRSTGELVSLGEELKLIEAYLDIERARFEERLRVRIDVPAELLRLRLPALLVQPLVENAIKHGIAPSRFGGEVSVSARVEAPGGAGGRTSGEVLCVTVADTGVGATEAEIARGRARGVGLSNVEQRLRRYGDGAASLRVESAPGFGTTVEIRVPVAAARAQTAPLAGGGGEGRVA